MREDRENLFPWKTVFKVLIAAHITNLFTSISLFSLKLDGDHVVPDEYFNLLWFGLETAPSVPPIPTI